MTQLATESKSSDFQDFGLNTLILKSIKSMGYMIPTAIQAEALPVLVAGKDILGQAATGTGKTAAFALPALSKVDPKNPKPQVLVMTPTRELAIQVAEAFESYGKHMHNLKVLPIYGGQGYGHQLKTLNKGAQVIVGTPGRIMDHIRRKTLMLDHISMLVLDEADEMLRMGFVEDVNWILQHTPKERQTALFSATMPKEVVSIACSHMRDPVNIKIKPNVKTATNIKQKIWHVQGLHKLDALTRILETTDFDALIIFARTKNATTELAENLQGRGYNAIAINGDIAQRQRENIIRDLKNGKIDIVIATDVAARGIDVERVSHVINFDMPQDVESYVHRIGRTGRAGRSGESISFICGRERNMLRAIERLTKQQLQEIQLPSVREVNKQRFGKFCNKITKNLQNENGIEFYKNIMSQCQKSSELDYHTIAASLAMLLQDANEFFVKEIDKSAKSAKPSRDRARKGRDERRRSSKPKDPKKRRFSDSRKKSKK